MLAFYSKYRRTQSFQPSPTKSNVGRNLFYSVSLPLSLSNTFHFLMSFFSTFYITENWLQRSTTSSTNTSPTPTTLPCSLFTSEQMHRSTLNAFSTSLLSTLRNSAWVESSQVSESVTVWMSEKEGVCVRERGRVWVSEWEWVSQRKMMSDSLIIIKLYPILQNWWMFLMLLMLQQHSRWLFF